MKRLMLYPVVFMILFIYGVLYLFKCGFDVVAQLWRERDKHPKVAKHRSDK